MEVKVMVVPGKIARVELVAGMTVLGACEAAERQIAGVDWVALAKGREVRVQNRRFSNMAETAVGYAGSIQTTPLNDGDVVLILTKIKGNASAPGEGVLICSIDGVEYALETPERIDIVLAQVAGYDMTDVRAVFVNDEESPLDQLVGSGDQLEVAFGDEELSIDQLYEEALKESVAEPEAASEASQLTGELDPDELLAEAARLEEQAEALRGLAEAMREVSKAKVMLAKLGYKLVQ